jgi:hypothetical protein
MGLYSLNIEKNYAWEVMETVGEHSSLHFVDSDLSLPIYNRPYISIVQRCDEALKKISQIKSMCTDRDVRLIPPSDVDTFLNQLAQERTAKGKDEMAYFEELEQALNDVNGFLTKEVRRAEDVLHGYNELIEKELVMKKAEDIVREKANYDENAEAPTSVLEHQAFRLSYIAGLICKQDVMRFKQIIYRKSRGNTMVFVDDISDLSDEYDKNLLDKVVYVIIFRGADFMRTRLLSVCEVFNKRVYSI